MIDEFLKQNYEPVYLPESKLVLYWIPIIKNSYLMNAHFDLWHK